MKLLHVTLLSFLTLYLELALVRYLPAYLPYLGYFTNFLIIAIFLGIGLGFILAALPQKMEIVAPFLLLLLIAVTRFVAPGLLTANTDVVLFRSITIGPGNFFLPVSIALPLLFFFVALVFSCFSQPLGRLFMTSTRPMHTYIADLTGAIGGIGLFSFGAVKGWPPTVWFGVVSVLFIFVAARTLRSKVLAGLVFAVIIAIAALPDSGQTFWSPYYKVDLVTSDASGITLLFANSIHHQDFADSPKFPLYTDIFSTITRRLPAINDVLIIGSGTGQDVAAALDAGAKHIDAVEIDPTILSIGRNFHPNKPYDDPRVTAVVDDGRMFLRQTQKRYDVIIYALTDSLRLTSGVPGTQGGVRLESFLFTLEAFQQVKEHLREGGVFVLYNDFRAPWLIDRIALMLTSVFGAPPDQGLLGPTARVFTAIASGLTTQPSLTNTTPLPTDDWPFLYLRKPGVSAFYGGMLVVISLISILCVGSALLLVRSSFVSTNFPRSLIFFFLGAAFSLIETKSIVQLNLLFGTTWVVNAIAFAAILSVILCALLVTLAYRSLPSRLLYVLLLVSLLVGFVIPVRLLAVPSVELRLVLVTLYFFTPIFFANLLFAKLFMQSKTPAFAFGSNILGLVLGGILEYASLAVGFQMLHSIAFLLYMVAIVVMKTYPKPTEG